jgi:glycosyltransferase involved in cell wall biosynthesis
MTRRAHTIFAFPKTGISYNEPLYAAIERTGTPVREGVWSGSWLLREVRRGDLLHIHWPSFLYFDHRSRRRSLVGLLRFVTLLGLLRARGARIVWTAHNLYPHDGGRALWVHRAARRYIVRLAEAVLVHGPTAARIVQKEFAIPARKIREIPHGNWIGYYPDTTTREAARRQLGIDDATYVYAFVGTCKPYKNLEGLLRAFVPNSSGARLLIAGHFQSRAYLEEIRRLIADLGASSVQLEPRFIADAELQTFLRAADAVVIPYREILTSGSAMLALGFGRPVVVPRLGALVDLVDDSCGVLYDADDPRGLERALAEIRAATFAEERILERARRFRWEDSAEVLVALTGSGR